MANTYQKRLSRILMYKHPIRNTSGAKAAIVVSLIALFVLLPTLLEISISGAAAVGPNVIDGFVLDSSLNPVQGASVTVDIMVGSSSTVRSTLPATTDSAGFYTVTFVDTQWEIGDTIKVTATNGIDSGTASGVAGDSPPHETIDVTFGTAIPEFGSPVLVTAALVGIVIVVGVIRRKRTAPVR